MEYTQISGGVFFGADGEGTPGAPAIPLVRIVNLGEARPGAIEMYPVAAVPGDRLVCDGRAVKRVDYPALYAAIGTAWGVGDGETTFNLPDLPRKCFAGPGVTSTITVPAPPGGEGGTIEIPLATIVHTIKA